MSDLALTNGHGPQIGTPCPRDSCDGVLGVGTTIPKPASNVRIRYLVCKKCGCSPENNKQIVPLHYAPPRGPKSA
jgi:hypothetical protein